VTVDEQTIKKMVDSPPAWLKDGLKKAAVAYCKAFRSGRTFLLDGHPYSYFYHEYNLAWRNERTVEIPVALSYLREHAGQAVLEVGNVLSHYLSVAHDVVDKYEEAPGVINEDVATFAPHGKYGLIISVSTLEHVGWDEAERDPGKALLAIDNLRGLLAAGGEFLITAPVGLNPEFDRLLGSGAVPFEHLWALKRVPRRNTWVQTDPRSVLGSGYPRRSFRADAIVVGSIREGQVTGE
jgi:hypothetical protein